MELDNILSQDKKEEKTELEVLKELFNIKNIETKTELTIPQVILINQKRTIAKLIDFKALDNCLDDFMLLMVSNSRKGRGEFVDGFKSNRENEQQKMGLFGNMRDKLGLR